jgi:hypothetical protein
MALLSLLLMLHGHYNSTVGHHYLLTPTLPVNCPFKPKLPFDAAIIL